MAGWRAPEWGLCGMATVMKADLNPDLKAELEADPGGTPGVWMLRGLSETLAAADDIVGIAAAAATWVRRALGSDAAVALALPDVSGRLRVVWRDGPASDAGRGRSKRRRLAFMSLRSTQVHPADDGQAMALLPLSHRGQAVGVLEIVAPDERIDGAWDVLEIGASQVGLALHTVVQNARLRREVQILERASNLETALIHAGTAEEAVGIAARFVWERFRVPVAGWYGGSGGRLRLVTMRGIGTRPRSELRLAFPTLKAWGTLEEEAAVKRRFAEITRVKDAFALDVGDAVLISGAPSTSIESSIEVVGSLLAEVLRLFSDAALAERRGKRDLSIAWTAHELRGPLLGVRAALEMMLERRDPDVADHAVLRTSLRELDHLTTTTEAILTWAAGERPLMRKHADLVRIVEEAVESSRLEVGDHDVHVIAPESAMGWFDPPHLRTAVSNLLRNALAYAYAGSKVTIVVEEAGGYLELSVQNEGPMIAPEERQKIFDPFVRSSSGSGRNGNGLGLYIARRVVESHGGRIWAESDQAATTFRVQLPGEWRTA